MEALANAYYENEEFDRSKEQFKKLARKHPGNAMYLYHLANAYFAVDNFKKSIEIYKKAI